MIGFPKSGKNVKVKRWHLWLVVFVCAAGLVLGAYRFVRDRFFAPVSTSSAPSVTYDDVIATQAPSPAPAANAAKTQTTAVTNTAPPATLNLAVPFTSQAPFGVWDALHEDACEEASLLMAKEFFDGTTDAVLDAASADRDMTAMVAAEEKLGLGESITAQQFSDFVTSYYRGAYSVRIIDNPSIAMLTAEIAKGSPVIVPAAGRKLGNPFFSGIGPLYHMLVIRGYKDNTFITNDPGTRHGEAYVYNQTTLMNAIGDWNAGDPEHGAKRVIVLVPKK